MATALFTIGYQGRTLDELIAMLGASRVSRLIDVRDLPLSRRRGFSKTPLREALATAGIEYVHLREAGNPYRRVRHTMEVGELLANYRRHLDGARGAVTSVADAVRGKRVALLCYELDHATCHRSILAPRVARKLGVTLTNL